MNEIMAKFESLPTGDLIYLFEYLVELINERKRKEKMIVETFKDYREFNNKFPSKIYICSRCGNMTTNPHFCMSCENQANNFVFIDKTYTYKIIETNNVEQIFKPLEMEKGKEDE